MSLLDSHQYSGGGPIADGSSCPRFRGVLQPSGSPQYDNPFILGGLVTVYWSEIEPANGVFHWEPIDQRVDEWIRHGKVAAIQVLVSATPKVSALTSGWDAAPSEAVPKWLLGLGIPVVAGDAGTVRPHQYWHPLFLQALQRMIHALGTRYDGLPGILFVNASVGCDGRTSLEDPAPHNPHNFGPSREELWRSIGYSPTRWMETIHSILDFYRGSFEVTPLVSQVCHPFPDENTDSSAISELLRWALSRGMWLEYDCKYTERPPVEPEWKNGYLVVKPRRSASQQGKPVMSDLNRMVQMGASYAFVHATDLLTARNRAALEWAAGGALT